MHIKIMPSKLWAVSRDTYTTLSVALGQGDEVETGDGNNFAEAGDLYAAVVRVLGFGFVADHDVKEHLLRHHVLERYPAAQDNRMNEPRLNGKSTVVY